MAVAVESLGAVGAGLDLFGTIEERLEISGAYFGEDGDGDGQINFASTSDDYVADSGFGAIRLQAFATLADDYASEPRPTRTLGSHW